MKPFFSHEGLWKKDDPVQLLVYALLLTLINIAS